MRFFQKSSVISSLSLLSFSAITQASGFALIEQSASGQGLSYAGAAASTEDASVMWFNPAGLTEVKGHEVILGAHVVMPKAKFSNNGSYLVAPGNNIQGSDDDGATVGFVPNFYWKGQYKDYHLGLGINVPFGQHISYDEQWVGRYHATETNLKTYNINPAISRKLTDTLSFGVGLNAQYVDLTMEKKANLGSSTGSTGDGNVKIKADSWGYGYNFGFLWQPSQLTQVGLSYRSTVTQNAKGTIDYTPNFRTDGGISSTVNLPAMAVLSVKQRYGQKFALLAGATWTKWSDYGSLVIKDSAGQTLTDTRQDFKDSWRYSLGGIYQATDTLKLRTGLAIDYTPISNETHRSPRTPDSTRKWVSVGAGYQFNPQWNLDLAYSHLFGDRSKVNYTTDDKHYLVGSYESSVDIVSAQLVWKY